MCRFQSNIQNEGRKKTGIPLRSGELRSGGSESEMKKAFYCSGRGMVLRAFFTTAENRELQIKALNLLLNLLNDP